MQVISKKKKFYNRFWNDFSFPLMSLRHRRQLDNVNQYPNIYLGIFHWLFWIIAENFIIWHVVHQDSFHKWTLLLLVLKSKIFIRSNKLKLDYEQTTTQTHDFSVITNLYFKSTSWKVWFRLVCKSVNTTRLQKGTKWDFLFGVMMFNVPKCPILPLISNHIFSTSKSLNKITKKHQCILCCRIKRIFSLC